MFEYLKKYIILNNFIKRLEVNQGKGNLHLLSINYILNFRNLQSKLNSNTKPFNIDSDCFSVKDTEQCVYKELDNVISKQEVIDAIQNLKRAKVVLRKFT